jgi:cell division protein FtsI (penicillin-binding protein 3)
LNNPFLTLRPISHPTVHLGLSNEQRVVDAGRYRILSIVVFFLLCYGSLMIRLVDVTMAGRPFTDLLSDAMHDLTNAKEETMTSVRMIRGEVQIDEEERWQPAMPQVVVPRQSIRDRNGVLLASSVATRSLYARPPEITNAQAVVGKLAAILPNVDTGILMRRLTSSSKFVQIKRHLTPQEQEKLLWAGIPGMYLYNDYYRIYPQGRLFSHVLGYTNVDGVGLAGVEKYFDTELKHDDALKPLTLSMDVRMQESLHHILEDAMQEYQALAVTGAIFHIPTGQARAMVSLPDFDPNRPMESNHDSRYNRLSVGQYELGSIFKTFTLAMAMQYGGVTIHDGFDATQPISFRGSRISDFHAKKRWLTVPEIMVYSSNIGTVRMANVVGMQVQRQFLTNIGMFRRVGLELNELSVPKTSPSWKPVESATISYGHGISVTPLHLIRGMLALNGGGDYRDITLLNGEKKVGDMMISPQVSRYVNRLMRAVGQHGTAKQADVPGYAVGAKTGTAIKPVNGRYDNSKNISSMVAAFPMPNPEYLVFVMLDEPHGTKETFNFATAGWVAAPAVAKVVRAITPMIGMPPIYQTPEDEVDQIIATAEERAKAGQPYMRPYVQRASY